jgi:hypothetical protein
MPNILSMPVTGRAGYLVSEASGMYRSRDEGTVVATAALASGTVLGRLTADGNYVAHAVGGAGGVGTVSGILFEGIEANTTAKRTITVRDCEVNGAHLIYPTGATAPQIATINAALAALGIIVR